MLEIAFLQVVLHYFLHPAASNSSTVPLHLYIPPKITTLLCIEAVKGWTFNRGCMIKDTCDTGRTLLAAKELDHK